jgi:RHS repeat-associated protein
MNHHIAHNQPTNIASLRRGVQRYGFNGKERLSEHGKKTYFELRVYSNLLGRFLSVDPLVKQYSGHSPYTFALNCPIRFVDVLGAGPGDRVKAAKNFVDTPYVQEKKTSLRTGTDSEALKNVDCSELVCRVLAEDGLTSGIKHMNTSGLKSFLNNPDKFHKSQTPEVGDIFLWRNSDGGHTGIVTGVNSDGTVEITHARGKKYGTVTETYKLTYFTGKKGWEGYFRPVTESTDTKSGTYGSAEAKVKLGLVGPSIDLSEFEDYKERLEYLDRGIQEYGELADQTWDVMSRLDPKSSAYSTLMEGFKVVTEAGAAMVKEREVLIQESTQASVQTNN